MNMTSDSRLVAAGTEGVFQSAGLSVKCDRLELPKECKRIKIDVGLSVNAPQSAIWLGADPELCVIGIEPLAQNIQQLHAGRHTWPTRIDPALIGKRLFVLPIALDNVPKPTRASMFVTRDDPGCSSLLEPTSHAVDGTQEVDVWPLSELLRFIPFDKIPFIEHVKIDAQGKDLSIFESAGDWKSRVLAVTLEPESSGYQKSRNSLKEIQRYMKDSNFIPVHEFLRTYHPPHWKVEVQDPTFVNPEVYFTHRPPSMFLYQSG